MSFIKNLIGKYDSNLVQKKVADVIPYDRNPKTHPDSQIEQLANSIREWGWTIPILIDEKNMVIAGHGRLFAAQKLEMEDVPCLVVSGWSDEQKKAYVIADNKLAEISEWDSDLYFSELRAINEAGFNLDLIGLDENISFDFEPNLSPMASFSEIGDGDMVRASNGLDANIASISSDNSDAGVEVMCPYCAESFKFSGS